MALRLAIALTSSSSAIVAKRSPLSPSFKFGNSQKSYYGAISGEFWGCGIVDIFLSAKNCRTANV